MENIDSHSNQTITVSVLPGAGGDDAKDWARMLVKMYALYAKRRGWKFRELHDNIIEVEGAGSYDTLRYESGVHRLVRISPYDAKKLRHTSFALVEVLPELKKFEADKVQIPEGDLKVEFSRSSGPGGQNVNKVETAVRLVHLPTGIVVVSQAERSQAQNKERALLLLKSKLIKLMKDREETTLDSLRIKVSPEWSRQIRSYVLHPYKLVKDHRTKAESRRAEEVLQGDLDTFIEAELKLNK
jgi:peptide chain release factor 2